MGDGGHCAAALCVLVMRTVFQDAFLQASLPGYAAFAQRSSTVSPRCCGDRLGPDCFAMGPHSLRLAALAMAVTGRVGILGDGGHCAAGGGVCGTGV
jgi:hypothetical protein